MEGLLVKWDPLISLQWCKYKTVDYRKFKVSITKELKWDFFIQNFINKKYVVQRCVKTSKRLLEQK